MSRRIYPSTELAEVLHSSLSDDTLGKGKPPGETGKELEDGTGASDSPSLAERALAARPVPGGGARYEPVYSPKRVWITGIHLRRITARQSQRRRGWLDWELPPPLTRCLRRLLVRLGISPLGESKKPGLVSRISGGGGRI